MSSNQEKSFPDGSKDNEANNQDESEQGSTQNEFKEVSQKSSAPVPNNAPKLGAFSSNASATRMCKKIKE